MAEVLAVGGAIVLWVVVAVAVRYSWQRPFRALGILVAGMAIHNFVLMALLEASAPSAVIRVTQAWKEFILLALVMLLVVRLMRGRHESRWQWPHSLTHWLDVVVVAFSLLTTAYFIVQIAFSFGDATLAQRLLGLRLTLLMPLLYLLGRAFVPERISDLRFTYGAIALSAAVVGVFGIWELWFVSTREWVAWGATAFSHWLGYDYGGPAGLPANFFQSLGPGVALRRMVSTYLSPLGIAYTGLILAPLAVVWIIQARAATSRVLVSRPMVATIVFTLIVVSIGLSLTRLALFALVLEFIVIVVLLRTAQAAALMGAVVVIAAASLYIYPAVGPLLASDLTELPSPTRAWREPLPAQPEPSAGPTTPASSSVEPSPKVDGAFVGRTFSNEDPSVRAHISALLHGLDYIVHHPLGTGPGSAVPRFGNGDLEGPSESALLRIGGELGVAGVLLYALMYLGTLAVAGIAFLRNRIGWRRDVGLVMLAAGIGLGPIMLTSDVWGNFSVMFLFWWLAGSVATAAQPIDE